MGDMAVPAVPFGRPMRAEFLLDPNYRNLNHGSYGSIPRAVHTERERLLRESEACPDLFVQRTQTALMDEARRALARVLHVADADELVLVKNATGAVNTVLRNLRHRRGDVVLVLPLIYGACWKTVQSVMESTPLRSFEVALPAETPSSSSSSESSDLACNRAAATLLDHDAVVEAYASAIARARAQGLRPTVAIFDTVASMPGVRLPFERLTTLCREQGVRSLVDGAHAIGQIGLDLDSLDPDFFVSNCHKWLYCPRGCAVLFVPRRNQHLIRTTFPTSWGFVPLKRVTTSPPGQHGKDSEAVEPEPELDPPPPGTRSRFTSLFDFTGTDDATTFAAVPAALRFRALVCGGEDLIMDYCQRLAFYGGNAAAAALGTEVLSDPGVPWDASEPGQALARRCAFANVRLPVGVAAGKVEGVVPGQVVHAQGATYPVIRPEYIMEVMAWFKEQLLQRSVFTFIPTIVYGGWFWVRFSAQVYVELADFEWGAAVLKEAVDAFVQSHLFRRARV